MKKNKRFRKIAAIILSFSMLVAPFANVEFKDGNLVVAFNKLVEAASGTIDSNKSINDVISDANLKTYILGLINKTANEAKVSHLVAYTGTVTVPSSVKDITGIGYMRNASSIDLSQTSITEIKKDEFNSCTFTSIKLPTTVTKIGENAFYNCANMATITNTSNIDVIGPNAFSGCKALTSISLKTSMTSIGDGAFAICSSLTSFDLPSFTSSSLTHLVPANIFNGCTSLESVKFQDANITTIKDKAFADTGNLSFKFGSGSATRVLPSSITTIGVAAFQGSAIESLDLSKTSITEISDNAFQGANLANGFAFPKNITKIGYQSFYTSKVTEIVMPNTITTLGQSAFAFTKNLTSIKISTNVKEIPATCFQAMGTDIAGSGGGSYSTINSTGIVDVGFNGTTSDAKLEYIGKSAFNCALISNTNFLSGLTKLETIDENAFSYTCFKNLIIPKCVSVINDYAFYAIAPLVSVSFANGSKVKELPNHCFGSNKNPEKKKIGENTYVVVYSCINLVEVKLPDSLESIGEYCFAKCFNLYTMYGGSASKVEGEINFPNTLNTIMQYAFFNSSYHEAVDLSENSKAAKGTYEFNNIPIIFPENLPDTFKGGMEVINIPDSVVTIGEGAFSSNLNLRELNIGAGVTEIPPKMCENCGCFASKKYVEDDIKGNLTSKSLGKDTGTAFKEDDNEFKFNHDVAISTYEALDPSKQISFWGLQKVTMSDNVTTIGDSAFKNSCNLSELKVGNGANGFLPNALVTIGENAFNLCKSLPQITIPSNLETIGKSAFASCAINLQGLDKINNNRDYRIQIGGLKKVDFSYATSITEIGASAFANCNLQSISIPRTVKSIPATMCEKNYFLERVDVLAEDGISIGSKAFSNCYSLKNATLPLSATWSKDLFCGVTANKNNTLTLTSSRQSDTADVVVGEEGLLSFKAFSNFGSSAHLTVSEISKGEDINNAVKLLDNNALYDNNSFIKLVSYDPAKAGEINVEGKQETGNTPVKLNITGSVDLSSRDAKQNDGDVSISVSQKYDVNVVQNKINNIEYQSSNQSSFVKEGNKLVQYLNIESTQGFTLTATYSPYFKEYDTTEKITWNSTNPSIVTFQGNPTIGTFNKTKGTNTNAIKIVPNSVGETVVYPTTPSITNQKYPVVVRVRVPAQKITMTNQLNLVKGGSFTLTPTLTYDESKYGNIVKAHRDLVQFKSSNEKIATVNSETGLVKAVSVGETYITCRSLVSGQQVSCKLNVVANATSVKTIELVSPQFVYENGARCLYLGTTANTSATIQINYTPQAVTDVIKCYSSNPGVVTIAEGDTPNMVNGSARIMLKAVKNGKAVVTIKGGNISATCTVIVSTPETGVSLSSSEITINKGKTYTLKGKVLPEGALQSLTWSSSDTDICTVSNGVVKAVSAGSALIYARSKSGLTATCRVQVNSPAKGLKIKSSTGNTKKVYVAKGSSISLYSYYTNEDCTDTFKFSAKKNKKGKVTEGGMVTAKKKGKFTVNLVAYNGNKKGAKAKIKVYVVKKTKDAKKVKISGKKKVKVGKRILLTAKLKPASSTNTVSWYVNKPAYATITPSGVLTARKKGKIKVTAQSQNGKKKTIKIKITK